MGKKEKEELTTIADILADVIAFLLKYKTHIQVAYNHIQKSKNNYTEAYSGEWGYDYCTLTEIKKEFSKIKSIKSNPSEILIKAYPLLVSIDHLVEKYLSRCIKNSRRRISHKQYVVFENGLNSEESQNTTNLMILPRWITMWEGSGEDREVESESFNRFLKHARYLIKDGAYNEKKYKVNCYYIDRIKAAYFDMLSSKNNKLKVGMCPMAYDFHLSDKNDADNDLYLPSPWSKGDRIRIKRIIINAIRKSEYEHVNLLVFPEMLGYTGLKDEICNFLRNEDFHYLKLIVLPSVWEIINTKGTNTACVIQASDGIEVLSQGKLVAYSNRRKSKTEALIPDDTLNLLYDEVHGCMGIMICKSALETKVRNVIVDDFGVKLMVIPSWSSEHHSFERMMQSATDMNCNMIWVNSCSALNFENDRQFGQNIVCMMTQICKVKGKDNLVPRKFHPVRDCHKECLTGEACLFTCCIEGVKRNE